MVPNISGSHRAYGNLLSSGPLDDCLIAAVAGAVTVSVEVTELLPGVTEVAEKVQLGSGAGPIIAHES